MCRTGKSETDSRSVVTEGWRVGVKVRWGMEEDFW